MKDKDRPSRIRGWLNGAVYVLFAVLAAVIVISMNFEAGVLLAFFLVFVAAVITMTLWLKRQLSTLPETGDEVQPAGAEAAALLEQREHTITALVETSTDWIWAIDRDGVHTYSNPAVESILGYSREELIGKLSFDLMHPEDKKEIEKMPPEWTRRKEGWRNQLIRWKHKEGGYRHLESNAVPILDVDGRLTGFRGVDRDVTERKWAEALLRESEELHRVTLRRISDAVFITDDTGAFTFVCLNVDVIFGYSFAEAEALGYVSKLLGDMVFVQEDLERHGELVNIERRITDKNGKCHYLLVTVKRVCISGGTVLYTCRDITELHEAEATLYWESLVNKALANLSNVLNKPHFSFEEISDFVLAHAKRLTGSKCGFAGYVDEQTGYLVCPTMTKDVWKQCNVQGKDIVFKKHVGLRGRVLNERESVLTNSPVEDPRAAGTPEGHIPIERFIGVPSVVGDEVIGMVAVANADRDYVGRDLWLVERLAETYALAIQSNRSQRRLEKHQDQLRDLVSSLGLAQERSARKLAAGLHAEIIDRLNSTRKSIASLDKLEGYGPGVDSMPGVQEALSDLVETTHAFASELSCPILRQSGLEAAVENWLTEDIRKKHGIETVFENDDACSVFDEDVGHFLFEAIKELLANTVEHAQATRVKVSLKRDGDDVHVAVADDGIGFDMAEIGPKTGEGARYNLFCIGERLRHLGGDMAVDSALGKGTTVVLKAPAKAMSGR